MPGPEANSRCATQHVGLWCSSGARMRAASGGAQPRSTSSLNACRSTAHWCQSCPAVRSPKPAWCSRRSARRRLRLLLRAPRPLRSSGPRLLSAAARALLTSESESRAGAVESCVEAQGPPNARREPRRAHRGRGSRYPATRELGGQGQRRPPQLDSCGVRSRSGRGSRFKETTAPAQTGVWLRGRCETVCGRAGCVEGEPRRADLLLQILSGVAV